MEIKDTPSEMAERRSLSPVELTSEQDSWVEDTEAGLTTAELLGNAALGIAALVLIWAGLQALGLDIVDWIRAQVLR